MGGNVQGVNFLGGSFPDTNIFATAKSLFVKSLLPSILNDYFKRLWKYDVKYRSEKEL